MGNETRVKGIQKLDRDENLQQCHKQESQNCRFDNGRWGLIIFPDILSNKESDFYRKFITSKCR